MPARHTNASYDVDLPAHHDEKHLLAAAAVLGISAITTQIILLREFLSVFYGNELIIGVVLANWMVLTGAGAFAGRATSRFVPPPSFLPLLFVLMSVLPPATAFALRALRNVVFTAGSMIGIIEAIVSSFVLLIPFCLTSGFVFAFLAIAISRRLGENRVGVLYAWESAGSALGGVVFNILLVAVLNTFQALAALFVVNLGIAALLARKQQLTVLQAGIVILGVLGVGCALLTDPDSMTRRLLFPEQKILAVRDTPYGNLTVTEQSGQVNLYENSVLRSSSDDVIADEERVHYALVQCRLPRRVLLVGGGIEGTTREALKYGLERVDYVEINPWVIGVLAPYMSAPSDPRIRCLNDDARTYIARTKERYDAVLVNLPDPGTAQLNRYCTVEFLRDVRAILNSGGVMATSLLPGAEYQGREARLLGSVFLSTILTAFPHVLIVPGERHVFIGSDRTLDIRIARLIAERGINTQYVNRFYIDDTLLEHRSEEVTASLSANAPLNTDFHPVAYSRQLDYWLSFFGFKAGWILVPLLGICLLMFWRAQPVGAAIVAGGVSASSAQVLLLVAFQTLCGSLYQMTGFLISAFMAGLAVGAGSARTWFGTPDMRLFTAIQTAMAIACFLLWPALGLLHDAGVAVPVLVALFMTMGFSLAVIVGLEFAVATSLVQADATPSLYGLDLVGSAFGALAVSVYALPHYGVRSVAIMAGLVSVAGSLRTALVRNGNPALRPDRPTR